MVGFFRGLSPELIDGRLLCELSHSLSSVPIYTLCTQISSSDKDTSGTGLGPTLMALFQLCHFKGLNYK